MTEPVQLEFKFTFPLTKKDLYRSLYSGRTLHSEEWINFYRSILESTPPALDVYRSLFERRTTTRALTATEARQMDERRREPRYVDWRGRVFDPNTRSLPVLGRRADILIVDDVM